MTADATTTGGAQARTVASAPCFDGRADASPDLVFPIRAHPRPGRLLPPGRDRDDAGVADVGAQDAG